MKTIFFKAIESKTDLYHCDTPQMRRQIIRAIQYNNDEINIYLEVFKDDEILIDMINKHFKYYIKHINNT